MRKLHLSHPFLRTWAPNAGPATTAGPACRASPSSDAPIGFPIFRGHSRLDDVADDLEGSLQYELRVLGTALRSRHQARHGLTALQNGDRLAGPRNLIQNRQALGLELGSSDRTHGTTIDDREAAGQRGGPGSGGGGTGGGSGASSASSAIGASGTGAAAGTRFGG